VVSAVLSWDDGGMRPTLLIVDDHPAFRSLARRLLEADGFQVVGEAADGHAAVLWSPLSTHSGRDAAVSQVQP